MRKIHPAVVAGAVVVGLGAIAGLAAFAPSMIGEKSPAHQLTLQLPDGGTETITYTGKVAPSVTLETPRTAAFWPALSYDWALPSMIAADPFIADMHRHLDMLASMPLLMPALSDQLPKRPMLKDLPSGTSFPWISETSGNGVCTRLTQITKGPDDAEPKVISQVSGHCGTGSDRAVNQSPTAKSSNPRATAEPASKSV